MVECSDKVRSDPSVRDHDPRRLRHDRRRPLRLHQFRAVHADRVAADRRLLMLSTARRADWCPAACSRWPRCPTSSSPTCCARAPGKDGMKFFPFVFSIFMFVLFANLIGLVPYFFTVTSHIIDHRRARRPGHSCTSSSTASGATASLPRSSSCRRACPVYLLPLVVSIEISPSCRGRSASPSVSSPTCWPATSR